MLAEAANLYHAAHTRRVSAAELALLQAKLPGNSSQIARGQIRRFESYMPSHAVQGAIHLSFSDSYLCDARLPISDFCNKWGAPGQSGLSEPRSRGKSVRCRFWKTEMRQRALAPCSAQCASGSGRSWNFTSFGSVPLPPSTWNGVRLPADAQIPRPFQPPFGSSIRPSMVLA